jgi:glutaminase
MCAIAMSCRELAAACDHLVQPADDCPITPRHAKRVLALMLTCGFYDESGEFAFSVGLSGKSGVGGGIIAVLPRQYSVAVLSPRLNAKGNSHRGTLALRRLTDLTGASLF